MQKSIYFTIILFITALSLGKAQICVGEEGQLEWKFFDGFLETGFEEIVTQPSYPFSPDTIKSIFRLQSPSNYADMYGGMVEGFIKVPTTEIVQFNVTANDRLEFFLSTDDNPANIQRIAFTNSSTGSTEHTKYPEQTSDSITLQGENYYFFRMRHNDAYGSDEARVFWKTELVDTINWNIITSGYLWGVGCQPSSCPKMGTSCDDNNALTINDVADGQCNCFGEPNTMNTCIGERSEIIAYRYDNITGTKLTDLYAAPDYPANPSNGVQLNILTYPEENVLDNIGFLVQGYLTVPVSGDYKFNVTGDDETKFFLSSDDDIANKEDVTALVTGWTQMNEYYKYPTQSTGYVNLQVGQYYYFEINQKEGYGGESFSVQWETPTTIAGEWKRMPMVYFYDYDCEIACIPDGIACNDGNIFTNNDIYTNCECNGTPCSGPDCDSPLANYVAYEPCGPSEAIGNTTISSWLSCTKSIPPGTSLDTSHWIAYDLGERYQLIGSHVWNFNVENRVNFGFENVEVYTSLDGTNWSLFGAYAWDLAEGLTPYYGFDGPNFNGLFAQHVLIYSLDPGNCRGISKVTFDAVLCPLIGTTCDDSDNLTIMDHYNDNCECKGIPLDANLCTEEYLTLGNIILNTNNYSAENSVQSISQIGSDERVSMIGGSFVELNPGFETTNAQLFLAAVAECLEIPLNSNEAALKSAIEEKQKEQEEADKISILSISKDENSNLINVTFFVEEESNVHLNITDNMSNTIYTLANQNYKKGVYKKRFRTKKLQDGIYHISMLTNTVNKVEKFMIENPNQ